MNDIPDKLEDGRTVEKVAVKVPLEMAQIFTRIVQVEQRLKNASSVSEGMAFAHQFSLIAAKASKDVAKLAEKYTEQDVELLNLSDELELLGAMASKVWMTVKAHQRPTTENADRRNEAFAELSKTSQNTGSAVREYLLALGDAQAREAAAQKGLETLPEPSPEASGAA